MDRALSTVAAAAFSAAVASAAAVNEESQQQQNSWGDYYFAQGSKYPANMKNKWALKLLHLVNENVPRFTDIFDEDTFYIFAALLVFSTFLLAFFASRIFKVRLDDHDL